MKRFATLLALLAAVPLSAQTVVPVNPIPGALNAAVNDAGVAAGTIFELQRGQTYLTTEQLNPVVDITIRADGTGDCVTTFTGLASGEFTGCALIRTGDPAGGGDTFRAFDVRDNGAIAVTLEDIALTNRTPNGVAENRQIRLREDGSSITATDVVFYDETEDVIRLDGPNTRVILDTVLGARIGTFDSEGNPVGAEGNFIDTRNSDVTEISIINSTFYSINNAFIRGGTANIGQLTLRNNTIHHVRNYLFQESGGDGTDPANRSIIENLLAQNLMVINAGYEGGDDNGDGTFDTLEVFEADSLLAGGAHAVSNINVFDPETTTTGGPVAFFSGAFGDNTLGIVDSTTASSEAPATLLFAEAQAAPFEGFENQPFDYSYTGGQSVTGGADGQPIGALVWFGLDVSPVADEGTPEALALRLEAFPNPTAGALAVAFELEAPGDVRVAAYDLLGRRVATLADGAFAAGPHRLDADLGAMPAGVYLVRLVADGAVATTRLTVVR
ncbi:MAG: T9SS type A sorting domain-containing protein [Bacteroidota bacterium]